MAPLDSEMGSFSGRQEFDTTHWSVVLAAGEAGSPRATEALSHLCQTYWYPLYAFVRRNGHDVEAARDLTQEFFARLLERDYLRNAAPHKGRFRTFLLVALKRFLVNEWHRGCTLKRGREQIFVPLDAATAEERYALEPADETTPETIYEQRWAHALLDGVMGCLQQEAAANGKAEQFELLQPFLSGETGPLSQAEIGARLGLSQSAVKSAVHRLRERYRELLRREISRTLANTADVEDELRHLLEVLRK
ncbi:MAG: sigma-70 family RNA polymerase sigma factor [Gemmataceae bacterium]|nr:sigma-70 family RNA polymerase sigma factor [Gemmataceae bacterium]